MLSNLLIRVRALFRRKEVEGELDDELRFHLEQQIAKYAQAGMTREEAMRRARLEFGGLDQVKEECREARGVRFIESLAQDFCYALRTLSKDRRFALLAILALALGIGAATVIFSVFRGVWLNAFPYKDPASLMSFDIHSADTRYYPAQNPSISELLDYREQNRAFTSIEGTFWASVTCRAGNASFSTAATLMSPNALDQLGVPPLLGTLPRAANEAIPPPVLVLDYKLWRDKFNGDPKVLESTITCEAGTAAKPSILDGTRKILAVMPPRLGDAFSGHVWIPFPLDRNAAATDPVLSSAGRLSITGRLKPGVSIKSAAADLDVIAHRLAAKYPGRYPRQFSVVTQPISGPRGNMGSDIETTAIPFVITVLILLLIACSNVANLLLSRATVRDREMALRASVGASRGRLIQQLLVESFVLAGAACVCGCFLAYWGLRAVIPLIPEQFVPEPPLVRLSPEVLAFSLAVTILCTVLCGLSPALRAVRGDLQPRLMDAGKGSGACFSHGKLRAGLVIGEVALSIVLLVSAGLVIHVFFVVTRFDPGYNPTNLVAVDLASQGEPLQKATLRQLLQDAKSLPGVTSAALASQMPGAYPGAGAGKITLSGASKPVSGEFVCDTVSAGYFRTLGLHLLRGRLLTPDDVASSRLIVVVNHAFVRRFFPEGDAVIGRKVKFELMYPIAGFPKDAFFEVVGMVGDITNTYTSPLQMPVHAPPEAAAYLPYTVAPAVEKLYFRTSVGSRMLIPVIRERLRPAYPKIVDADIADWGEVARKQVNASMDFNLLVFGTFAGVGLILVLIGVFSVMAYTVSLQTREIGIRMALGAQREDVLRMVLGKGATLMAAGLAIGLFGSLTLARLAGGLVPVLHFRPEIAGGFQTPPGQIDGVPIADPWAYGAVVVLIVATGLAACYFPARRAARVDPMIALRHE